MRCDLIRRIVILSSNSPGDTGTLISFIHGILAKFAGIEGEKLGSVQGHAPRTRCKNER